MFCTVNMNAIRDLKTPTSFLIYMSLLIYVQTCISLTGLSRSPKLFWQKNATKSSNHISQLSKDIFNMQLTSIKNIFKNSSFHLHITSTNALDDLLLNAIWIFIKLSNIKALLNCRISNVTFGFPSLITT